MTGLGLAALAAGLGAIRLYIWIQEQRRAEVLALYAQAEAIGRARLAA